MEEHLLCPIDLEYFVEPISTPCCGNTISRNNLIECLKLKNECPLCKGQITNFEPTQAPVLKSILALVELCKKKEIVIPQIKDDIKEKKEIVIPQIKDDIEEEIYSEHYTQFLIEKHDFLRVMKTMFKYYTEYDCTIIECNEKYIKFTSSGTGLGDVSTTLEHYEYEYLNEMIRGRFDLDFLRTYENLSTDVLVKVNNKMLILYMDNREFIFCSF